MIRWAAAFILSLWVGIAHAAVAIDVRGTEQNKAAGTSANYTGLTTGTGLSNPAIVCQVIYDSGTAVTGQSATWAGSATGVTKLFSENNTSAGAPSTVELWGIIPTTLGAQTFALSWTSPSTDTGINCISFTGVNQTGGTTSFPHAAGANDGGTASTPATVTITSAVGDWIVGVFAGGSTFNTPCTSCTSDFSTSLTGVIAAGADITGASPNFAMSYGMSAADNWTAAGTDVAAATAAATCPKTLALTGVGC